MRITARALSLPAGTELSILVVDDDSPDGTGKVADQNYLPHIVKNDDVVLSYYNRTQAKAQAMADKYGGRVADSLADLMADDPDTVLVALSRPRVATEPTDVEGEDEELEGAEGETFSEDAGEV